jgi:8-hydroxy-5-deazaflavin:NADPH oxidoreductase
MKIGIIGAGNIGATAAKLFLKAGHEVAISNSRGPESLRGVVAGLGQGARAMTVEEAAKFGDVLLVSIPFGKYKSLPAAPFYGKVVIDSNNYYPDRDGQFPDLDRGETTSSEALAAHLHGARIVKGFNTIWWEHLNSQGDAGRPLQDRRAIFIAGDDSGAKETVAGLIEDIGFAAVDMGFLHEGGARQQPGAAVYNRDVTAMEAKSLL